MRLMPTPKKLKRIARHVLTAGASMILGLLSFGGTYVLFPSIGLALTAFILSVAYEGEIYGQNIKGAFKKIAKPQYAKERIYAQHVGEALKSDLRSSDPTIVARAQEILKFLKALEHESHHGSKISVKQKKDELQGAIMGYLDHNPSLHERIKSQIQKVKPLLNLAKAFSLIAAVFMSLGTTYLLMETFAVLPLLASLMTPAVLPFAVAGMSLISGLAYGFLTFNALHDMIVQDTLQRWYQKITTELKKEINSRTVFMAIMGVALTILAIALTVCTAGTWWTIVQSSEPAFKWMTRLPRFIMGVLNPLMTSLSSIVFNLQNTSETLDEIYKEMNHHESFWSRASKQLKTWSDSLFEGHNLIQKLNPFRIIIKCVVTPARFICFFGHLLSIGVTADRVPGMSERASATLGTLSECFEDLHYYIDKEHNDDPSDDDLLDEMIEAEHGHSHESDLPTRVIKFLMMPFYYGAALWDSSSSRLNEKEYQVDFTTSYTKLFDGLDVHHSHESDGGAIDPSHHESLFSKPSYSDSLAIKAPGFVV